MGLLLAGHIWASAPQLWYLSVVQSSHGETRALILTSRPLYIKELVLRCVVLHVQRGLQTCAVRHKSLGHRTTSAAYRHSGACRQLPLCTGHYDLQHGLACIWQCMKKFSRKSGLSLNC